MCAVVVVVVFFVFYLNIDRIIDLLIVEYIELFREQFRWVLWLVFVLIWVELISIFSIQF